MGVFSPTSSRPKSHKRYTSKKVSASNIAEYHIDKGALRKMSQNLKRLHDDIVNKKFGSSYKASLLLEQVSLTIQQNQQLNSATLKKKHQPS